MRKKYKSKYISVVAIRKIEKKQKELQLREFERKGRRAKSITFYEALDVMLREARQ